MQRESLTHYSEALRRDMHMMIYGHKGVPLLCFATRGADCHSFEDSGAVEQLSDYLEQGKLQLYTVDSVDLESWASHSEDKARRAERQEQYYRYIVEEVVPLVRSRSGNQMPLVAGVSLGALHAAIVFLRRPDLFAGLLALSGVYDADVYFGGWMNSTLYDNAPERFLPNMPADHRYVALYNQRKMIFCSGQGAWEEDSLRSLRNLQRLFYEKGILAWCDYWGNDVSHDWSWWHRQFRYFLPYLLR